MKTLSIRLSDQDYNDLKQVQKRIPLDWQASQHFNKYLKLILQMGAKELLLKLASMDHLIKKDNGL